MSKRFLETILTAFMASVILTVCGSTSKAAFGGRTPDQLMSGFDSELKNGSLAGDAALGDQASFSSESQTTIHSAISENPLDEITDAQTYFFIEEDQDGSIKSLTLGGNSSLSLVTELFNLLQLDDEALTAASEVMSFDDSQPNSSTVVTAGGYEFTGIQSAKDPVGQEYLFVVKPLE